MTGPTYPLFSVFACVGSVLVLIPLPWHLQAWNSGTCYYMIWTSLGCLNFFINSVVWSNTALDLAPVWCDISTRIIIATSVGIPASSLCIIRRLYKISRVHAVIVTKAEKQRAVIIDSLICVLFPLVCVVLAFFAQGHRFNIYEEIGCYPAIYGTLVAYFLVYMWPTVIGIISALYCILALRQFLRRQAQFSKFLNSGRNGLTKGRYLRLMALAMTEIMFTIPFGIYEIYSNAIGGVEPWLGLADAHFDFSRVELIPSAIWRMNPTLSIPLQLSQWILPTCAFVFFAYFGFAEEARRHYALVLATICKRCPPVFGMFHQSHATFSGSASLPSFVARKVPHDLATSFPKTPNHKSHSLDFDDAILANSPNPASLPGKDEGHESRVPSLPY